jgi:hypothetical protein
VANIALPAGARVVSTTASDGRLVVTVELGVQTEVHLFDLDTLKPRGKITFGGRP